MTREEFASLPPMIALGLIFDVASAKLRDMPMPAVPRPPRYDDRFTRQKGKFCWMSEMMLGDLEWWRGKKAEGAEGGGQYAESDRKAVAKLDKWIEWRRLFPNEVWSGTRGDDRATAAPPSREPRLHAWGDRKSSDTKKSDPPPADEGGQNEEPEYSF